MKKLLIVLISMLLIFTLTACGNEEAGIEDNRTIEYFIQAFEDAGYEVRNLEFFGSGEEGRVDAVIFDIKLEDLSEAIVTISHFYNEEALAESYRIRGGSQNSEKWNVPDEFRFFSHRIS